MAKFNKAKHQAKVDMMQTKTRSQVDLINAKSAARAAKKAGNIVKTQEAAKTARATAYANAAREIFKSNNQALNAWNSIISQDEGGGDTQTSTSSKLPDSKVIVDR